MTYATHRPEGVRREGDSQLVQIVRSLRRKLAQLQRGFAFDTLRLDDNGLDELAGVLVDFAEDLHNNIGLWTAYEAYNVEFFRTPLPLTTQNSGDIAATDLHTDRFHHLLWILYPALIEGLVVSPTHQDLMLVSETVCDFFRDRFESVPRDSGVQAFLREPAEYGWDVKRKLIWLGTHSYMFRTLFANYIDAQNDGADDVGTTDDFICQECTRWSGLGAIDILAGVLDISDGERRDLRSWYERHVAFYKILSASSKTLEALNVISDRSYRIRMNMPGHPFEPGQLVFGSLVPWRGEWYWSGQQQLCGNASDVNLDDIKQTMKRQNSQIVCRYWKEYETLVRRHAAELHAAMLEFYGRDLIVYPDGLSMAADLHRECRRQWESMDQKCVQETVERHGLKNGRPEMSLPDELLEHKNGIGVFINPEEGKEIMQNFASITAGLERKGEGLTEDEEYSLRGFIEADAISPAYVRRVLDEYSSESVKVAFLLRSTQSDYWLEYLMRSFKGQFYRKRYPCVSVV